jgi:uncharacterized membrane protein YbhN (UPF0104 family)
MQFSLLDVGLLVMLSLILPFFNGMINTYMFRSLGADFSHQEGFLVASVSTLANQLPLSGGIVTRAIYLKHRHNLSYAKYFSSMLALFFCSVAVYGFLGLGILLYWTLVRHIPVSPILFIAFGLMSSCFLIFWMPLDRLPIPKIALKWLDQALEGWMLISKNLALLAQLLVLQTATMFVLAARYWLAFHMLSQDVTVSQVVLFASASVLTQLVSFAPGGLGVREVIVAQTASALGFKTSVSIVAVGLDRLIATVVVVLLGWVSTIILGKQIPEASLKQGE